MLPVNVDSLLNLEHEAHELAAAPEILIVDDQRNNLFALETILKGVRARIIRATSGDEALALSLQHDFVLAILDVQMPEMDGYELAEILLGNPSTASLPIIFVSAAHSDEAHQFKGYDTGAVDYLVKPIDPKVLIGKVSVFLELARTRAALESLVRQRTVALEQKAGQLRRRNRFKALLSDVSRDITRRNPAEVPPSIERALARVATLIGASRAEVQLTGRTDTAWPSGLDWQAEAGPTTFMGCEYALEAILAQTDESGVIIASLDALPDGAVEARATLQARGIRALLVLPLIEERVIGGLVFSWSASRPSAPDQGPREDLPDLLSLVPDLIFGTLQRTVSETHRAQSEAQHRLLFETMAQGVIYQNAEGVIIEANPAAEQILGLSRADMGAASPQDECRSAVHEDGTPFAREAHPAMQALRSGQTVESPPMGILNGRDGDRRWVQIRAVPLFRPGEQRPFQVYTTFSDLTALRRATEEKERLMHIEAESRAKSRFLASMSHEVRTPMNAILGYTQLLLRDQALSQRQRDYLETIDRSGEHLITLVNNVLDMARIESGKDGLDLAPVDFSDLLTDVERMFSLRASEKRLVFSVEQGAIGPRSLRIDAGKVRQVLINLLGNAMKFTQAGEVILRASASLSSGGRARVVIEVRDTGIGIPPELIHDIFEPFVQVSRSVAAVGTGLGLAVSRRFARLMGGDVTVSSELGVGSTFRFEFEADVGDEMAVGPLPPRVVGLVSGGPSVRVLIVEDDRDNRAMLANMLRSIGLSVRETSSADEAVTAFTEEPCELVLTDLCMPGADGLEVTRRIRALPGGAEVPVVVVSASPLKDERDRVLAAGVAGFMPKPVRESGIFEMIGSLTRARFAFAGDAAQPLAAPLTPETLTVVAPAQRSALVLALKSGYAEAIAREIDTISATAPHAASELRRLAEGFEYGKLLKLVEAA